jgi:CheY-like chemotaxis protein
VEDKMGERILVVDDDLDTVRLVGLLLEKRGYEIVAAASGEQAIEKAQTERPDLVILDIMMPDMDGYEVCRRLRSNVATSEIPVMMFTAKTGVSDKVEGFQVGSDDYLTKPIHAQELTSRVEAVLSRAACRKKPDREVAFRASVIGFLGAKGGVGTTTLAANTAIALGTGRAGDKRVVFAEMHSGMAPASFAFGLKGNLGLAKLLAKRPSDIDAQLVDAQLEEHSTGVMVLNGELDPPGAAQPISVEQARAILQYLGAISDFVVLDLGVGVEEVNRTLLPLCHRIAVVVEPEPVALALGNLLLGQLESVLAIPSHKVSTVQLSRTQSAANMSKQAIEEALGHELAAAVPPAPELASASVGQGVPMLVLQPTSLFASQVRVVAGLLAGE